MLTVNPLLREIIERMASGPGTSREVQSKPHTGIIEEELAQARGNHKLPLPSDGRLIGWLQEIKAGDILPIGSTGWPSGGCSDKHHRPHLHAGDRHELPGLPAVATARPWNCWLVPSPSAGWPLRWSFASDSASSPSGSTRGRPLRYLNSG